MTPIHYRWLSKLLVGHGQVYDGCSMAVGSCLVVSQQVVISNYQPVLLYHIFPVCGFPLFCAPQIPALAVDIDVSRTHHVTSTMPDKSLPWQSPHWLVFGLLCLLIIHVWTPERILYPSFPEYNKYDIACIITQVGMFIWFISHSLAQCCPHPLGLSTFVCHVVHSNSCSFSWWFLQTHHICLPIRSSHEHSHGPYFSPGALV